MIGYKIACLFLSLIILAFVPGIIASVKSRPFSKWYFYGLVLFPVALFHSIVLEKPRYLINVFSTDKKNPTKRIKKTYTKLLKSTERDFLSPPSLLFVFVTKLLFGVLVAFAAFALARVFADDSQALRLLCSVFAIVFAAMLSVVEVYNFSFFPRIADEITKRALLICASSLISSFPFFLIKRFVLDKISFLHTDFLLFVCTVLSFSVFLHLLIKLQRHYYCVFYKFTDYCILSLFSYAIFAAGTLIWMSVSDSRSLIFSMAMPVQLFNLDYLSGVDYIKNISYIYASALVHLFFALIILYSGLMCRRYKRKELMYRIEYRAKAFNMSRKRVLRRSVPAFETKKTNSIYQV